MSIQYNPEYNIDDRKIKYIHLLFYLIESTYCLLDVIDVIDVMIAIQ